MPPRVRPVATEARQRRRRGGQDEADLLVDFSEPFDHAGVVGDVVVFIRFSLAELPLAAQFLQGHIERKEVVVGLA